MVQSLKLPSKKTTFLNLLDCHDGISVVGARDVLNEKEIKKISKEITKRGGKIGYKKGCERKEKPYEFNIAWWSAIEDKGKTENLNIKKYIASRAIQFSIKGIPAIYLLGLFGIENCMSCFKKSGKTRDINRKNFTETQIKKFLNKTKNKEYKIFFETCRLLKIRRKEKAFHPSASQKTILLKKSIFSIIRTSLDKKEKILVIINISAQKNKIKIAEKELPKITNSSFYDLVSQKTFKSEKSLSLEIEPFQVMWLKF